MLNLVKVVFLDRDGVINKYPGDTEYVKSWEEFQFLPNIKPALKKLNDHSYKLFVISNQAGVSKGIYSQEELGRITRNMLLELKAAGVTISNVCYCTHRKEDNCSCRKPRLGLLESVIAGLKKDGSVIHAADSYFIGDTISDVETGRSAGLKTILVFSGKEKPENKKGWQAQPDFAVLDLSQAVEIILRK